MMPAYDRNNVVARILRGEEPCTKVFHLHVHIIGGKRLESVPAPPRRPMTNAEP